MSYVVIITGGIGSGKTAVSDLLQARGAAVVDTDVISRRLTAPGGAAMPALVARFGADIAAADGGLDRDRMRALVFGDPEAKRSLESILHPMIRLEAFRQVHAASTPYVVLVVPLLVESNAYRDIADRVLVVDCPEAIQIERTMRRSGLAREQVERIVQAQAPRSARLALADDVVVNDAGLDELTVAVERLHMRYLQWAADKSRPGAKAPEARP
ncbi:MAG: dephospho-CoA kinase [Betaproteobacteria bacterium]|nr:dephospho-CoA kinase [Betaproteobacteria bacterium]